MGYARVAMGGVATSADIKALQYQINRYVGVAITAPIDEDGVVGAKTVAAAGKIGPYIASFGGLINFASSLTRQPDAASLINNTSIYLNAFKAVADMKSLPHKSVPKPAPTEQPSMPLPGGPGITGPAPSMLDSLMAPQLAGIPLVALAAVGFLYMRSKSKGGGGRRGKR